MGSDDIFGGDNDEWNEETQAIWTLRVKRMRMSNKKLIKMSNNNC
jgi:hypothetical protein